MVRSPQQDKSGDQPRAPWYDVVWQLQMATVILGCVGISCWVAVDQFCKGPVESVVGVGCALFAVFGVFLAFFIASSAIKGIPFLKKDAPDGNSMVRSNSWMFLLTCPVPQLFALMELAKGNFMEFVLMVFVTGFVAVYSVCGLLAVSK